MDTAVVWFRDDLRLTDNPTLAEAVATAETVVPIYVTDPRRQGDTRYGTAKRGPIRAAFRRACLADLRHSLRERGGELLIRDGRVEDVLPALVADLEVDAVYAQTTPGTEEQHRERAVWKALPDAVTIERRWTHTLYHPADLPTPVTHIDDTFTPWRTDLEKSDVTVREPVAAPEEIRLPPDCQNPGELPRRTTRAVPEDDRAVMTFDGGETAGKRRVESYLWEGDHLREYKQTRNGLLGMDYSSKFSPWLAAGCLSPRWIHREITRYEKERVANEDTYWLVFELLWRDYFQFQLHKHGADLFTPSGIRDCEVDWRRDRTAFRRWAAGETGVPFVDANMRELNRTGYISNRGRQNVASFLADALEVDWRWGAAYFEERLIDYDVASNWGNWAYQAGVGNDSRDNHFNVLGQAEYYDPDAEYVTTWLPALEGLPPEYAHRPWRASETAEYDLELGVDYPRPMIDVEARYEELENG